MNYSTWNDIICSVFFSQKESMTFLSIDKETLIDAAMESDEFKQQLKICSKDGLNIKEKRRYAWSDFLHIFYNTETNEPSKKHLFQLWHKKIMESVANYNSKPRVFPILALFIIPLSNDPNLSAQAFYPKVNDFLKRNHIISAKESINTPDMTKIGTWIDVMWIILSEWAAANGYIFSVSSRSSSGRATYAQPFLSQLIFTANQRSRFKLMFYKAGLTPAFTVDDNYAIRVLSNNYDLVGLTQQRWEFIKSNYRSSAISIFQRELDAWDGMAIVQNESERHKSTEYLGVNQNLLLRLHSNRFGWHFGLCANLPDASFGEEFTYNSRIFGVYNFTVDNNGLADSAIWNDEISLAISKNEPIQLSKDGDRRVKLTYSPTSFVLLEYSFGHYVACRKLQAGREYMVLVRNDKMTEYQQWITDNSGEIVDRHPLSSSFTLIRIQSAVKDAPASSLRQLHFETKPSIELVDTISLGKTEDGAIILYNGFPAYFKVQGINITTDRIHAFFNSEGRTDDKDLEYDKDSNLWRLPVVRNIFMLRKQFQIYCNDQALSPTRYKIEDFKILDDSDFDEIQFNRFGEYDEAGEFVGLKTRFSNTKINWTGLYNTMQREGDPIPSLKHNYSNNDFILYFLSSRPRYERKDMEAVIRVLIQNKIFNFDSDNKWAIRTLVDNYFRLGYINYAYIEGKHIVAVNKPSLLLIPPKIQKESVIGRMKTYKHKENFWTCLFTGARTPDTVNSLIQRAASFTYKGYHLAIRIEDSQVDLLPQSIFILSSSIDALAAFAEQYGYSFSRNFYSASLLESIASLDDYLHHSTQTESESKYDGIDSFERIDYRRLAEEGKTYKCHDKNIGADVVSYFPGSFREKTILWLNGRQYDVDKHWGHLLGMKIKGAKVIKYSDEEHLITMPITIQLPRLYARALTMITGRIPLEANWQRVYEVYDSPWAKFADPSAILMKINQQ